MNKPLTGSDLSLGRPLPIKLSRIRRFEGQPRTTFRRESIERLADSIQTEGQQQPVKVCTLPREPDEPAYFELVDGERRLRAFHLIWERTGIEPVVEAFIEVVPDRKQHFRKSALANLHREDLTPLDTAATLARLREDGESVANLALLIGKSVAYVDNYLKLDTLPEEVKALMDPDLSKEEALSVTQAIDIARGIPAHAAALRIQMAYEIIDRELDVASARVLIERHTGERIHRAGSLRKPHEDYRILRHFITRNTGRVSTFLGLDIDELYFHRESENEDRERDARALGELIGKLERLQRRIENPEKQ